MKIKIIKTLCSILSSGTIMLTGISAGAAEKIINPVTDQPDNICGKVNIITTTDRDTYVSIYKRTPNFRLKVILCMIQLFTPMRSMYQTRLF